MEIQARDIVALVVLVGIFVLIFFEKIGWEVAAPIISAILFFYFGYSVGVKVAEASRKG